MAVQRWFVLGTGPFALEVYDWAFDAIGEGAASTFGGFLGEPNGAAPQTLALPAYDERDMDFTVKDRVFNAISDPATKEKVCPVLLERGVEFEQLVHPTATVRAASLGQGTIICPGTVIGSQAEIGHFVTINYQCGIGHEVKVGDFCNIAPGVQIGGRTSIGRGTGIGLSASIIDNVKVGEGVSINAGAVVISRIRNGKKVSGNPARKTELF
ncbi:MAG: acetyltransferase [Devosiaceae bacterium]|nr:acetyltransferase [Devosiaceae bacterium]